MWFVPLQGLEAHVWLVDLVGKLLRGDELALRQFSFNPFPEAPPRAIRLARYRYRLTGPGEEGWYRREQEGFFLGPLALGDPLLEVGR